MSIREKMIKWGWIDASGRPLYWNYDDRTGRPYLSIYPRG